MNRISRCNALTSKKYKKKRFYLGPVGLNRK